MRTGLWSCLTLAWLAGISTPDNSPSSATQTNGNKTPSVRVSTDDFIAAFNLTPKGEFRFLWPPASMRAADYDTVLLIVERMPQVWNAAHQEAGLARLRARDLLRINGQPPKALPDMGGQHRVQSAESEERFVVKLDQGRLRITLLIPAQLRLDPLHNNARIRLYRRVGEN